MSRFIANVNEYLSAKKIKQTYISSFSGIDVKKLSRILTGAQEVTGTDMEKIAEALGKSVEFFLQEKFEVTDVCPEFPLEPASYSEGVDKYLEAYTVQLVELLQNADEILGAKSFSCIPWEVTL